MVSNCFVSISWIEKKITKDVLTFFFSGSIVGTEKCA